MGINVNRNRIFEIRNSLNADINVLLIKEATGLVE
jgi:hypothetical protein